MDTIRYRVNIDKFKLTQQIQSAQKQLEVLQVQVGRQSPLPEKFLAEAIGAIEELTITLEELQIAAEDLQQHSTELSEIRQNMATESLRYQQLSELTPDAYLVTDSHQIIREANTTAAMMLNVNQSLLVGKPLIVFISKTDRKTFYSELTTLTDLGQSKNWEMQLQPRKCEPFPAVFTVGTIHNSEDDLVGFGWLIRDITERKRAEQAQRELEAEREFSELKSRFIQTVSHEFRTPLSIILSSSELLEKYSDRFSDQKKVQHFQKIRKAVGYTTQLLDDVLVLSKADAEKLAFNPTIVDLEQFCLNLVEEHQLISSSKHQIHFTTQGKCRPAYLDEKLLRYIFGNLLSNALKYSPQGGIVWFTLIADDGNAICHIQDQGIGIPPEDQQRLFEPFHRSNNIGSIPGTGLGLAIVKRAVDLHTGAIAVESEVGVGTTFTVTLPLNQVTPKESQN
jgi:PAS domain S-box-containing protein